MSRLPVKSLLRFKCVSKTWYNLIKNPTFIKQHQTYSNLNPNPAFDAVLSTVTVRKTGKQIFRLNQIDALDKPIDLDLPFISDDTGFSVLSICDGLVCIMLSNKSTPSSRIAICNPLTGEFRLVPDIDDDCTYFELTRSDKDNTYFGFGLNGDKGYEFFKMYYEACSENEMVLEGEAYSLSTNTWRTIDVKQGDFDDLVDHSRPCASYQTMPVFVRGVFYWAITDFDVAYVVSLDVEKEIFDKFWAPYYCSDERWTLCDFMEEVAVVQYHDELSFDVWVLNERENSWEKKLEMEEGCEINDFRSGSVVTVLGRARSGKLLVEDYAGKFLELFLYDMHNNDVEDLPYVNCDEKEEVFLYTEPLVSVNVGDDVVESGSGKKGNILRM